MTHRRLIAIDFDGVLHSYTSPWTDASTIANGPTPGAMAFLRALVEDGRFEVVVVSSRLATHAGEMAIRDFLDRELVLAFGPERGDAVHDAIRYSTTRPPAFLTIDDRAVTFTGVWPDLDAIAVFKPWNKRPAAQLADVAARVGVPYGQVSELGRHGIETVEVVGPDGIEMRVEIPTPGIERLLRLVANRAFDEGAFADEDANSGDRDRAVDRILAEVAREPIVAVTAEAKKAMIIEAILDSFTGRERATWSERDGFFTVVDQASGLPVDINPRILPDDEIGIMTAVYGLAQAVRAGYRAGREAKPIS